MKPAFTFSILALALLGLAPLAHADYWATLAGASDSINLKSGETALIMSVDDACVVQYTKRNKRPVQFEVGGSVYRSGLCYPTCRDSCRNAQRPQFPLVLSGPARVSVKTTNVVSLKVVQTRIEKPEAPANTPAVKKALWQSLASR